jgi:hypothetical protein
MNVKLTRKQELHLIGIGLSAILDNLSGPRTTKKSSGKKWTPEQRKKFAATMTSKFGKKFKKN